jgi:hypothetical protein
VVKNNNSSHRVGRGYNSPTFHITWQPSTHQLIYHQFEDPPSFANLITQIDRWIIYHLKATINSEVHYENQLYGCLNTFLFSLFPPRRQFLNLSFEGLWELMRLTKIWETYRLDPQEPCMNRGTFVSFTVLLEVIESVPM